MRQDGGFQEFYEANYGRIVAMSAAVLGNRQGAEAAAQEAFALPRWSRLGPAAGSEGPAGWPCASPSTPAGGCGEPPSPQSRSPLSGTHSSQSQQTRSPSPPSAPRAMDPGSWQDRCPALMPYRPRIRPLAPGRRLRLSRWPPAKSGSGSRWTDTPPCCPGPGHSHDPPDAGRRRVPRTGTSHRRPSSGSGPGGRGASDCRAGDREPGADEDQRRLGVVRLGDRREGELGDRTWTKDKAVRRTAVLEVSELVSLPDVVAGPDLRVDHARRNLYHADGHEGHQSDDRVVGLDEDDCTGRDVSQVGLRVLRLDRVGAFRVGL